MQLRSYYAHEASLVADIVRYLAINQPIVSELSATKIVFQDGENIVRESILEDSAERLNLAFFVVQNYVLATGRCPPDIYWPVLRMSPLRFSDQADRDLGASRSPSRSKPITISDMPITVSDHADRPEGSG